MEYQFNSINKIAEFNTLNQGDDVLQHYLCTLFFCAVNIKYNCGIEITEDDINKIAERQVERGLLRLDSGGKGSDGVKAIIEYIKEHHLDRGWNIPNLAIFKKGEEELQKWIDRGYMVGIGILVNRKFPQDAKDGKLDLYKDYVNYKGKDLAHFTNIVKWIGRGDTKIKQEEFFVDSYAWNKKGIKWIYDCSIKEVLEDIAMNTRYIFF